MGGVSAAVSKTAAAPIERVKLLIQNQVSNHSMHVVDLRDTHAFVTSVSESCHSEVIRKMASRASRSYKLYIQITLCANGICVLGRNAEDWAS